MGEILGEVVRVHEYMTLGSLRMEYGTVTIHEPLIKYGILVTATFVKVTRVLFLVVDGIFFLSTDFMGITFSNFVLLLLECNHLVGSHHSGNGP
jgi:hypothetical protein